MINAIYICVALSMAAAAAFAIAIATVHRPMYTSHLITEMIEYAHVRYYDLHYRNIAATLLLPLTAITTAKGRRHWSLTRSRDCRTTMSANSLFLIRPDKKTARTLTTSANTNAHAYTKYIRMGLYEPTSKIYRNIYISAIIYG